MDNSEDNGFKLDPDSPHVCVWQHVLDEVYKRPSKVETVRVNLPYLADSGTGMAELEVGSDVILLAALPTDWGKTTCKKGVHGFLRSLNRPKHARETRPSAVQRGMIGTVFNVI